MGGATGSSGATGNSVAAPNGMFQGTLMMSLFQIAGHVFSSMAIAMPPTNGANWTVMLKNAQWRCRASA